MDSYGRVIALDLDAWQRGSFGSWVQRRPEMAEAAKAILTAVSGYYGVPIDDLTGARERRQHMVLIRDVAIYLIRTSTGMSYPRIGKLVGRDHSTVIHGYNLVRRIMEERPAFAQRVEECRRNSGISNRSGVNSGLNGKGQGIGPAPRLGRLQTGSSAAAATVSRRYTRR